ncbi:ABC transporter permease [Spirilliplanes yamanashiensis]|uniref:ABC transporter n=1 Tax=Spirilliplanes yamanashiensis TaxID=42233 RepID=A0A8J4DKT7_9ACTN|nr:ABC transporter permease [Spirilliplanes yamanashiensis]MDP9817838.1 putative ABC transport system permease protein [Spirilliplanes yamanashiensis]GIJ04648.1 ABC transporter [Spirilliplanes yamanashiensis]
MLRATLKSLLARKLRLVLSGLAVVLGVMFVSGSFVLTDTLSRSFDKVFGDVYALTDVGVSAAPKLDVGEMDGETAPATLPAAVVERVRAVPGVASATGLVAADGARVIGADGKVLQSFGPPRLGENWTGENELLQLRSGRGPQADDEIALNADAAARAGLAVGDSVGVLTLAPKQQFTLVGTFGYSGGRDSLGGSQEVMFTTPVAQRLMLGEPGVFTEITVTAADGVAPAELRDDIAAALGAGFQVRTGEQLAEDSAAGLQEGLSFFTRILLGFAAVALFVGIFLILNTFSIIVAQRTRELALLRALGANRRQVIGSVLVEALVIGFVAAILGLAAGVGAGAALAWAFGTFGAGGLQLAGVGLPMSAVVSAFAVGVVVTVVAAVLPAIRASRIPPVAALQEVATPDRPLTAISVAGALVTAAGGAGLALGMAQESLTLLFGGVLTVFIGVALLTPLVSRPVVGALGRLFAWSVPGRLGRLNSGRNPRRTAITAAALMVGIALVTGVTVVMDSAKSSLAAQAEDAIKAEVMISGEQTGPRPPTFDAAVLERAAAVPGVRAVAGVWNDVAEVGGELQYVNAADDLARLADVYGATAATGSLATLRPDQAVLSTDEAAERGLAVGATMTVQLAKGEERTYTVAGTYADGDLPGSILLPAAAAADFGIAQPVLGFVRLADGATVASVLPAVSALVADSPEVSAIDRSAFIEQQTAGFDQVITMIQILLGLAILIAVLGVVNTLALSVLERTRELGLLRAVGLGRAQTMRMITVEAVVIAVFGALLGVVVGAGLGWAMVEGLSSEGIDKLVLPWQQMGVYLGLAALVGVVAAVVPSIRAARLNVLGAIAHE